MTIIRFLTYNHVLGPLVCLTLAWTNVQAAETTETPAPLLSAYAALGSSFAQGSHMTELGWEEAQIAAFLEGVNAAFHGKAYPLDDSARKLGAEMGRRVQELMALKKQQAATLYANPDELAKYMNQMRKRYALQQSATGLAYTIKPGPSGTRPRPEDTVVVSWSVTAADGVTPLPSLTITQGRPKVSDLLPGLREALQMMTVESQARLILPPGLSFGAGDWPPGVDRGTPLLFVVTLHEVIASESVR